MAQIDDIDQSPGLARGGVGCAEQESVGIGEAAQHGGILGGEWGNLPGSIRVAGEGGAQMIGTAVIGGERNGAACRFAHGRITG